MIFDTRFTWNDHVAYIKVNASKYWIFCDVCRIRHGEQVKSIIILYKSLIRSVIDYGSIIYDSAESNITCKLDKLQNQCLRTCCGALKSTPINAIQNYCGIIPLNLQRKSLQLKYISKVYIEKDHHNASLLERGVDRKGWVPVPHPGYHY